MLGIFLLIEWSIRHDARCKVSLRIVVLLVVVKFLQGFFTNYWNPPFHRTIFQMFLFQPLFNHPSWSQLSALVPHFCTAFTKAVPASHWNSKKLFYKPGSFFEDSVQIQLVRVSFILNNGVTDTNLLRDHQSRAFFGMFTRVIMHSSSKTIHYLHVPCCSIFQQN